MMERVFRGFPSHLAVSVLDSVTHRRLGHVPGKEGVQWEEVRGDYSAPSGR